jgi:hypothetical protein
MSENHCWSISQRYKELRLYNLVSEFDNFKPRLPSDIFKCISCLIGSFFFWGWWWGFFQNRGLISVEFLSQWSISRGQPFYRFSSTSSWMDRSLLLQVTILTRLIPTLTFSRRCRPKVISSVAATCRALRFDWQRTGVITVDATKCVFCCPPAIVKFQPQRFKT